MRTINFKTQTMFEYVGGVFADWNHFGAAEVVIDVV